MRLSLSKIVLMLTLLAITCVPSTTTAHHNGDGSQPGAPLVKAPFEVRLRKLHLVRPDLIPFPVYFEVYC